MASLFNSKGETNSPSYSARTGTPLAGGSSTPSASSAGYFGAAASLASTAANYELTQQTNRQNKKLAKEQMAFQERMSNSAHAREIQDMRNAGLNPILSMGGSGASTPGGASATMDAPSVGDLGASINSARQASAAIENVKQDTNLKGSQEAANKASTAKTILDAGKTAQETENVKVQNAILQHDARKKKIDTDYYDQNKGWLPAANAITPLVGQGIGAATNALSLGSIVKGLFGPRSTGTTTQEHYNSQGEHLRTTTTRKH